MLLHYIHFRRFYSPYKAFKLSCGHIGIAEPLIFCLVMAWLCFGYAADMMVSDSLHKSELILAKYQSEHRASLHLVNLDKMERVVIGCLNREPIQINGRSMDCQIKNHREALDI